MNSRRCIRIAASSVCAAAFVCATAGASAQTIYKRVTLGGDITYTNQPNQAPLSDTETGTEPDAAKAPGRRPYIPARLAAAVNANEAERRLAQAQLKRRQGIKPLPGEQVQGSNGTVLNYRYWQRQEKLRLLVEQAQQRLIQTRRPLVAAR
jgi:hypothetical protein